MPIVTIALNNKNFKLACPEEHQDQLLLLASKLNADIENIKLANPSASFELLLVMAALKLQDAKESKIKETGGELLEGANRNFQNILSNISAELKTVAKKFE